MKPVLVISLGGSVVCPDGPDTVLLKAYQRLFQGITEHYQCQIILVIGGGHLARDYISTARNLNIKDNAGLDQIGIATTRLNAELVLQLLSEISYRSVCHDPTQKIRTTKPVLLSGGWKPGFSTDYVAVEWAKTYHAQHVINLTNVDYVYTKDPTKYPDAQKLVNLDWVEFRKLMVGARVPAGNWPFDPIAAQAAQKENMTVHICNGRNIRLVKTLLGGLLEQKTRKGKAKKSWTTITPSW